MSDLNERAEKFIAQNKLKGKEKYFAKSLILSGSRLKDVKTKIESYRNINTGSNDKSLHSTLACPRCKNTMKVVTIANGRKVKYCIYDRVTLPLPVA